MSSPTGPPETADDTDARAPSDPSPPVARRPRIGVRDRVRAQLAALRPPSRALRIARWMIALATLALLCLLAFDGLTRLQELVRMFGTLTALLLTPTS